MRSPCAGRNQTMLWEKARRIYWITVLGPALAKSAGGSEAARNAGANKVVEIGGSLVITATNAIADSLNGDFSTRIRTLRKWLWPHSIQNPADSNGLV